MSECTKFVLEIVKSTLRQYKTIKTCLNLDKKLVTLKNVKVIKKKGIDNVALS
jgi:hypothetical protein